MNWEVSMGKDIEKVTLAFEDVATGNATDAPMMDGALALTSAEDPSEIAAARAAEYAQAWGLTIPANFTPATRAQVAYWWEVCGAISRTGKAGMRDDAWPAELAPSKPTLQAIAERGLIARRGRAWRLKRKTFACLQYLRLTAVATPPLTIAERPAPHLPTYAEITQYQAVCQWLDGQPRCRARLPMPDVPTVGEVAPALLQAMRKHKLVRQTADCSWALASRWREILLALWQGRTKAEAEQAPGATSDPPPTSVASGLDTLYVNRIDPDGLPAALGVHLEDLQELARANDEEVDTLWRYDGVPLRMYRSGANTRQGGGVSWSYILRNPSLTLLIRKTPLGGIVAQARLGSECLWRLTPLRALDELDALVGRMWHGSRRHPRKQRGGETARWQVSQAHLCHDVANAPITLDQLDRYLSRSRRQAVYAAGQAELRKLYAVVDGQIGEQGEGDPFDPAVDLPLALADELGWEDAFAFVDEDDLFIDDALAPQRLEVEAEPVEERALQVHRWGIRLSGVSWSAGGDIAFVQYDKTLEARQRNKRFMEPIWRANGWDGKASVTRHEARWRRPAVRSFVAPGEESVDPDDPWVFVRRLRSYWGYTVGSAPATLLGAQTEAMEAHERLAQGVGGDEACVAPGSEVDVAWIRRVTPVEGDTNRSRWPTDPTWQVVQAATFADADPSARRLMHRQQRLCSVEHLDAGAYGYLVSRTAYLHPEGEHWDVSWAARELVEALSKIAKAPNKDFGQLVRERRRQRELPVLPAPSLLPVTPAPPQGQDAATLAEIDDAAETLLDAEATDHEEQMGRGSAPSGASLSLRLEEMQTARLVLAERRLYEVLLALEEAERGESPLADRAKREAIYSQALRTYEQMAKKCADGE
jgi:hypothetical protein